VTKHWTKLYKTPLFSRKGREGVFERQATYRDLRENVASAGCRSVLFGRIRANMLLPRATSVFCSGVFGRIRDSSTSREYASTVTTAESFWTFISSHSQISTLQNHVQLQSQFHPHPTLANIFCRTSTGTEVKE
jgi:hypothetical protein